MNPKYLQLSMFPKERVKQEYPDWFEKLWDLYPYKVGKKTAFERVVKRMCEGFQMDEIMEATRSYVAFCEATGRKLKDPATFWGPQHFICDEWKLPQEQDAPPKSDEDLVAWGAARGIPARAGETYREYRSRLEQRTLQ